MTAQAARLLPEELATAPARPVLADYLTRDELAVELRVSAHTLRRWEKDRTGPPSVRIGNRKLFNRETVRQWLAQKERDAQGGPR